MPSLTRLFQKLSTAIEGQSGGSRNDQQEPIYVSQSAPNDTSTTSTHYLSTPLPLVDRSPYPAIRQIPSPSEAPISIPPDTLLFTLTHPHPHANAPTGFFLHCVPDPIGFLHHCIIQITSYLSPTFPNVPRYRNQSLSLILDPEYDGLAATSGGQIRVSLQWVKNVQETVRDGREIEDATKEFKGVLLHELTHAIQHDGYGTTPTWFTESIADWIRLRNGLGPRHWKKCGEGRREKGWETGYDVGAWFLDYLVGDGVIGGLEYNSQSTSTTSGHSQTHQTPTTTTSTSTTSSGTAPQPQSTAYTPPSANHQSPYPKPIIHKQRPRPPIPDLVRKMDARLEYERWDDGWWVQMAGAPIEVLWREYQEYYS